MFPSMVSWLTMMWALGNFIALMAFGNLIVLGIKAGVEQVMRGDRSSRSLRNDKKVQ